MTDSVLSISGCFVRLRVPTVLLAVPSSGTEGQHLEELAGSVPLPVGSSSLPQKHSGGESRREVSWGHSGEASWWKAGEKREKKAERRRLWGRGEEE